MQRRHREALVDVAQDRLRLVELEAVMLEGRHLGKGVAQEMRLRAMLADCDLDKLVGDPLFGKRQAGAPHIGAARRAIDDRPRHVSIPFPLVNDFLSGCRSTYYT